MCWWIFSDWSWGGYRDLVPGVCWWLWCKYAHLDWFQHVVDSFSDSRTGKLSLAFAGSFQHTTASGMEMSHTSCDSFPSPFPGWGKNWNEVEDIWEGRKSRHLYLWALLGQSTPPSPVNLHGQHLPCNKHPPLLRSLWLSWPFWAHFNVYEFLPSPFCILHYFVQGL